MNASFQNPDCYAKALQGCAREMSREHFFSRATLDYLESFGGVTTQGVHWVRRQDIPLRNMFQVWNLCRDHNTALSPLDTELLNYFRGLQTIKEYLSSGVGDPPEVIIEGNLLERWCLKALCGFVNSGNVIIKGERFDIDHPPAEWLRMLYAMNEWPQGTGLFKIQQEGNTSDYQTLGLMIFVNEENILYGAMVELGGHCFMLSMLPGAEPRPGTLLENAVYHPSGFAFSSHDEVRAAEMRFTWANAAGTMLPVRMLPMNGNPPPADTPPPPPHPPVRTSPDSSH